MVWQSCKNPQKFSLTLLSNPYLKVQVDNVVVMEVLNPSANLPHEQATVRFCEVEVIRGDSLKQLSPIKILHDEDHFTRGLKRIDKSE